MHVCVEISPPNPNPNGIHLVGGKSVPNPNPNPDPDPNHNLNLNPKSDQGSYHPSGLVSPLRPKSLIDDEFLLRRYVTLTSMIFISLGMVFTSP